MNRKYLINLLADHADALINTADGQRLDTAAWLSGRSPGTASQHALLLLAEAVSRALKPVEVEPQFDSRLQERLRTELPPAAAAHKWTHHVLVFLGAALFGLVILLLRHFRSGQEAGRSQPAASPL